MYCVGAGVSFFFLIAATDFHLYVHTAFRLTDLRDGKLDGQIDLPKQAKASSSNTAIEKTTTMSAF
jgi:hypothetical protein